MIRMILTYSVIPPGLQIMMVVVALVLWRFKKGLAKALMALSFVSLWAFSTPVVVGTIFNWLETYPLVTFEQWEAYKDRPNTAIVVLGGGKYNADEYGGQVIMPRALARLRYGVRLKRITDLPVLVSGGTSQPDEKSEAELMAEAFSDFGINNVMMERLSHNTWENAKYSSDLLLSQGITDVILVTHAWHMRRSVLSFESFGMKVIPAPTIFQSGGGPDLMHFLPNAHTLLSGAYAFREVLGLAVYTLFYTADTSAPNNPKEAQQSAQP